MIYIATVGGSEEDCCIFDSVENRAQAIIKYIKFVLSDLKGIKKAQQHKGLIKRFVNIENNVKKLNGFPDHWNNYWETDIENGTMPSFLLCEEDDDEEEGIDYEEIVEYKNGEFFYV